jgi:hypothetical protein
LEQNKEHIYAKTPAKQQQQPRLQNNNIEKVLNCFTQGFLSS